MIVFASELWIQITQHQQFPLWNIHILLLWAGNQAVLASRIWCFIFNQQTQSLASRISNQPQTHGNDFYFCKRGHWNWCHGIVTHCMLYNLSEIQHEHWYAAVLLPKCYIDFVSLSFTIRGGKIERRIPASSRLSSKMCQKMKHVKLQRQHCC